MNVATWLWIAAATACVVFLVSYRELRTLRRRSEEAWHQVELQLGKRDELVPALTDILADSLSGDTRLTALSESQACTAGASSVKARSEAEAQLNRAIHQILSETPEVGIEQLAPIRQELDSAQNRVDFARRYYNDIVLAHNHRIAAFPNRVIAGVVGCKPRDLFEPDEPVLPGSGEIQI